MAPAHRFVHWQLNQHGQDLSSRACTHGALVSASLAISRLSGVFFLSNPRSGEKENVGGTSVRLTLRHQRKVHSASHTPLTMPNTRCPRRDLRYTLPWASTAKVLALEALV